MGLDYRTFVADDGGLGTIASPSDDDGEVSAIESQDESENPLAGPDDEDCDGAQSDSADELCSDVEAEELAKKLAMEKPVWTQKNKLEKIKADAKAPARPTGKWVAAMTNKTYKLPLKDLDNSGSSGSEFKPEDDDELPSEEYTVDTGDDSEPENDMADEVQPVPGATTKAKKPTSNKASATRGPKAKQLLEQPIWKDILLAALAKSHGPSAHLPENLDLSAFAEEVHAHVMHQVVKAPTPSASSVSIPSYLGFVVGAHPHSTSGGHRGASTSSAPPPPGPPDNHGSPYKSDNDDDDDDGHSHHPLAASASVTMAHQPDASNNTGQAQDKPAGDYIIVPPTQPGGTLQLMVQDEAIRTTVRHAIADLDRYLAFENGFPDAITRTRVIADLLTTAARLLGFDGLQDRLKMDQDFTRTLSALPKQCMSTFRGNIKKLADAQVVAFYGLMPGECCEKVEWLFFHLAYIYPFTYTDEKKTITWSAPHKGPIIRHLLHLAFCSGPASIAAKNPDRFKSSMETMPQAVEKEMPMPMVALVGAAIHAALSEWRTGVHKPMAFSADAFADAYNEHILLLTGIKDKNIRGYHAMMHRLYREATGITPPTAAAAAAPNGSALDQVDFANMDMD